MVLNKYLTKLALENPGVAGKFKLAAGVFLKRNLIAWGVNSYKTHPITLQGEYKEEQVYLHAEADALRKALKLLTLEELSNSSMEVVRVKKNPKGLYVYGMAKPCKGCLSLIKSFGIKEVRWSEDENY